MPSSPPVFGVEPEGVRGAFDDDDFAPPARAPGMAAFCTGAAVFVTGFGDAAITEPPITGGGVGSVATVVVAAVITVGGGTGEGVAVSSDGACVAAGGGVG